MKLDIKAFALALGIAWGAMLFLMTWRIILWNGATGAGTFFGMIYMGYPISPPAGILGLVYGFAIGGALVAWLYNGLAAEKSAA